MKREAALGLLLLASAAGLVAQETEVLPLSGTGSEPTSGPASRGSSSPRPWRVLSPGRRRRRTSAAFAWR